MHRYTQQELEEIFSDKLLAKELIPFIKNNKIRLDIWIEKYKNKWKIILNQLLHGILCPVCGTILFKFYDKHLKTHGLSILIWYDTLHNIKVRPRCPICGKSTKFLNDKLIYRKFCGNSHARKLIDIETGLLNDWIIDDIEKHNKRIQNTATKNAISLNKKYGSQFKIDLNSELRKNRNLENDHDYELWRLQLIKNKSKAGKLGARSCMLKYPINEHLRSRGFRTKIKLPDNRIFTFVSLCELFHFLKLIYINKVDISQLSNNVLLLNNTNEFDGRYAYTDLMVNDPISGYINYEIHNINDIENITRKKYCSELNGIVFALEDICNYIYPSGKYVKELQQYGIHVDKLYNDLETTNHTGHSLKILFTEISSLYII